MDDYEKRRDHAMRELDEEICLKEHKDFREGVADFFGFLLLAIGGITGLLIVLPQQPPPISMLAVDLIGAGSVVVMLLGIVIHTKWGSEPPSICPGGHPGGGCKRGYHGNFICR